MLVPLQARIFRAGTCPLMTGTPSSVTTEQLCGLIYCSAPRRVAHVHPNHRSSVCANRAEIGAPEKSRYQLTPSTHAPQLSRNCNMDNGDPLHDILTPSAGCLPKEQI